MSFLAAMSGRDGNIESVSRLVRVFAIAICGLLLLAESIRTAEGSEAIISQVGFESMEGFQAGHAIQDSPGWTVAGGRANVTSEVAQTGTQSLEIAARATVTHVISAITWPSAEKVVWVDFWIKPQADASANPATTLDADGARIAFIRQNGQGTIYAYDPDGKGGGNSLPSGVFFPLDAGGSSAAWIRVTLREDFQCQTWDLFLDGKPVLGNLRMDNETPKAGPSSFALGSPDSGETFLDYWTLTLSNPLFADADNDGIPDTYERAFGYDPNMSNRTGSIDPMGAQEFQKFLDSVRAAQSFGRTGTTSQGQPVYVDQKVGKDSYSGLLCYASGSDGPKASIHAAMAVARKGDTIIINNGVYDEGGISVLGRPFNLKTVGTVKF